MKPTYYDTDTAKQMLTAIEQWSEPTTYTSTIGTETSSCTMLPKNIVKTRNFQVIAFRRVLSDMKDPAAAAALKEEYKEKLRAWQIETGILDAEEPIASDAQLPPPPLALPVPDSHHLLPTSP